MTGMVERLAKAIYEAPVMHDGEPHSRIWELLFEDPDGGKEAREEAFAQARAVLQELKAHQVVMRDPRDGGKVHELCGAPNDIWQAMLNAALSDSSDPVQ